MPLYRVTTNPHLLSLEERRSFSTTVTDVHCEVTGAPRSFVHVLFTEEHAGSGGAAVAISGTIRRGRNEDQKREIDQRLRASMAQLAGVEASDVEVVLTDISAGLVMEGGEMLPEPGSAAEAAWHQR